MICACVSNTAILSLRLRCRLEEQLVDIAPAPILARLEALHHRVLRRVEMLGGVLAGRLIAATDMAANQAHPQVNPAAMRLQAFLATLRGTRGDVADLIEVRAGCGHWHDPFGGPGFMPFWAGSARFSIRRAREPWRQSIPVATRCIRCSMPRKSRSP